MPTNSPASLLTPEEAAAWLGVKAATLERWRNKKTGPAFIRVSHNCVRYRLSDLTDFAEQRANYGDGGTDRSQPPNPGNNGSERRVLPPKRLKREGDRPIPPAAPPALPKGA